jgi:hypothetical protein
MSGQRVRLAVLESAETAIRFAANATSAIWHSKFLLLGALAALLVLAAVPILSRADMPSVAANGTLTCYDSAGMPILCRGDRLPVAANRALKCNSGAGNSQPCLTRASASPSRAITAHQPADGPTTAPFQQASSTPTAPYQQASDPYQQASETAPAPYQQPTPVTAAPDQQTGSTPAAVVQPANWTTGAPAARRSISLAKRRPSARCRRHSLTCFFSALRRGVTHMASVAANMGRPPGGEHL